MWSLGDKIASSIVAQSAGVPTVPWSGDSLTIDWDPEDTKRGKIITIPDKLYKKGCVETAEEGLKVIPCEQWRSQDFTTGGGGGGGGGQSAEGREGMEIFENVCIKVSFLHINCNCRIEVG